MKIKDANWELLANYAEYVDETVSRGAVPFNFEDWFDTEHDNGIWGMAKQLRNSGKVMSAVKYLRQNGRPRRPNNTKRNCHFI